MAQLVYELSFKGLASDALASAFPNCVVDVRRGVTVICGPMADQVALQGLIGRVHALGLELLELHLVAELTADDDRWVSGP